MLVLGFWLLVYILDFGIGFWGFGVLGFDFWVLGFRFLVFGVDGFEFRI